MKAPETRWTIGGLIRRMVGAGAVNRYDGEAMRDALDATDKWIRDEKRAGRKPDSAEIVRVLRERFFARRYEGNTSLSAQSRAATVAIDSWKGNTSLSAQSRAATVAIDSWKRSEKCYNGSRPVERLVATCQGGHA